MAEQKEPPLSDAAIELIRVMAVAGTNINRIRAALRSQEGIWFRNDAIIAAGRMFELEIARVDHSGTPHDNAIVAFERQQPKRIPDKVRLVPSGTFRTPGGYRMGAQ